MGAASTMSMLIQQNIQKLFRRCLFFLLLFFGGKLIFESFDELSKGKKFVSFFFSHWQNRMNKPTANEVHYKIG